MRIYDISLTISPDLPTWPGDPRVALQQVEKMDAGSEYNLSRIDMSVHTGTHVDAPYHFLPGGKTVDSLSLSDLNGRAYVLHLPEVDLITAAVLEKAEIPPRTRRILFKTRNSQWWTQPHDSFHTDFVAISPDGAQYLVERGFRLVGIDYFSVAPFDNGTPTHAILLRAGMILVEGLDLSKVSQGRYTLYCLPLKLAAAEGAPTRAILIGV